MGESEKRKTAKKRRPGQPRAKGRTVETAAKATYDVARHKYRKKAPEQSATE